MQKQYEKQRLFDWIAGNYCKRRCQSSAQAARCLNDCKTSLKRLHDASDQVRPGKQEKIQFPSNLESPLRLQKSNDATPYTAMMFAGSAALNGKTSFVARLCTHACNRSEPQFDSTLVLGQLASNGNSGAPSTLSWRNAAELVVPHNDGDLADRSYVGPEDPRMDIVGNLRFLTVTMNVDASRFGCRGGKKNRDVRHMFFVPVDVANGVRSCDIRVEGVDHCQVQKNWASLVPRGSQDIFYVYSLRPLQMFRFNSGTCKTNWLNLPNDRDPSRGGPRPYKFDDEYGVHGGTRYVFGGDVVDGSLYWSIAHTPAPDYRPVLVGILHRSENISEKRPEFQVVGVSCPVNMSKMFGERLRRSDESWERRMLIPTSIVDYNREADVSTITFQVHDHENYQTQLFGVGAWLDTLYQEFLKGIDFSCHSLHSLH
jgi:hypothetical protein